MHCPHCASATSKEQIQKTTLGYRTFRCSDCKRCFNEGTGTPFNFLEYPTDVVLLVVLFGNFDSAARFCRAFDEIRNYLHPRSTMGKPASRSEQRRAFLDRLVALKEGVQAIS